MNIIDRMASLDRRWIFLMMGLAVGIPIIVIGITGKTLPEEPTPLAQAAFNVLDDLDPGSRILMAWDFDPASEGELGPMATSFIRQCAQKGHRMYFIALWPVGAQMIRSSTSRVIGGYYPDLVYGKDWVDLGFKAGNEAVIKTIVTDFDQYFPTDARGTSVDAIPMMEGITSLADFDALVNASAGYPGSKEWVLYAATPLKKPLIIGCTGVQAPQMYPYVPNQVQGLLGAIKGAAEYESIVNNWVRSEQLLDALESGGITEPTSSELAARFAANPAEASTWTTGAAAAAMSPEAKTRLIELATAPIPGIFLEAQRRMGPQLVAHLLMIGLIIAGNVIFFANRRRGASQ